MPDTLTKTTGKTKAATTTARTTALGAMPYGPTKTRMLVIASELCKAWRDCPEAERQQFLAWLRDLHTEVPNAPPPIRVTFGTPRKARS
jgi:hypothetical protein